MPPAARVTDIHICPKVEPGPAPHFGGPILPEGEKTVLIGFMPAAREGDKAFCAGPSNKIQKGAPDVLIGGQHAARVGDPMEHGGFIVLGFPTVIIGDTAQGASFMGSGAPLVKPCDEPKDV
jgi:uncharacterized Zn-binding protein involved in type VI secretion